MLLERLSDGMFHSGERLALELGISRTAVWKRIKTLTAYGLDVYRVRGRGYRLPRPLELLDIDKIRAVLAPEVKHEIDSIELLYMTDSTNRLLMDRIGVSGFHGSIALAEFQSAGRGRRGRHWLSPLGAGICLSAGWHFDAQPEAMPALSLAAGVAIVRSLHEQGLVKARLKWPNDIICAGKKLGGILLETRGEMAGPCDIVLGIGINYQLPEQAVSEIAQPVTDICSQQASPLSRNRLAGVVINSAVRMLKEFSVHGFAPFSEYWRQYDWYAGKQATLLMPDRSYTGKVLGVSGNGLLRMSIEGEIHQFANGELSLRITH